METNYLKNLTDQQLQAACSIDKPTMLLAVPGSGKTTTLVSRLGYMIYERNIPAEKILTITYTDAASRDMKARFVRMFGSEGNGEGEGGEKSADVKFQTINAFCQAVIYHYSRKKGSEPFQLLDKNIDILKEVYLKVQQERPQDSDLKDLQLIITHIKNQMLEKPQIAELKHERMKISELYETYIQTMRDRGLMDYDDQMVYAWRILNRYPDILKYYQKRYPYICVDEAQDTSRIQHEIIRLLASAEQNLFLVGDEDQSIYGFRGAYPQALMEFKEIYPQGQVLLLEQNFRSTPQIVTLADSFIARSHDRYVKHMFTNRESAKPVRSLSVERSKQYEELVRLIEETKTEGEADYETAILYRNNDSAIPVIYQLMKAKIPFRMRGMDASFFNAPAVQFVRDVFNFAYDTSNCEIFLRIYWKLESYINKEDAYRAAEACRLGQAENPLDAMLRMNTIVEYKKDSIRQLKGSLMAIRNHNAAAAIAVVTQMFRKQNDDERIFLLRQLSEVNESSEDFLNKLNTLQNLMEKGRRSPKARVVLSTIHSSKGLEFDRVIIIDAFDGILPSSDDEEERRIFYVAATRAKNDLIIFSYKSKPSQFVDEFFQREKRGTGMSRKYIERPKRNQTPAVTFEKGERVEHEVYGYGTVKHVDEKRVEVMFDDNKPKRFLSQRAGEFLRKL